MDSNSYDFLMAYGCHFRRMIKDMKDLKKKVDDKYLQTLQDNRTVKLNKQLKWFREYALELK